MKLNKTQAQKLGFAQDSASKAHGTLCEALAAYNTALDEARGALAIAVDAYNEARETTQEIIVEIGEELREVFDAKSEKWQESDAGESAGSFISTFEDCELEEFSPDMPEDLEEPDDIGDALSELTEESE